MNEIEKFAGFGEVRVRFAPSPTGDLHVGGVRTALFNYLYARRHGGKFLLRVEDTDRERSTPAAIQVIFDGLKWLGLDWDEDVVYQSRRIDEHRAAALKLLQSGAAYRCFCSQEETARARAAAKAQGLPYRYDRRCRAVDPHKSLRRAEAGEPFAVRLAVPDEPIAFRDGVHGDITVEGRELEDFILLRSDGTPTYLLAVVVDDIFMGITDVIRGDDHITNTPKQILIYRGLGAVPPRFSHIPLILGPDKKKLSKRHSATSITAFRDMGFLPETMVNYLGLLGWSPGDDRNEISRAELIELFDIPGIIPRGAVFDEAKLRWLNGLYISRTPYEAVAAELRRFAAEAVDKGTLDHIPTDDETRRGYDALKSRMHTLRDLFDKGAYLFRDPEEYDPKGVRKYFQADGMVGRLMTLADIFAAVEPFTAAALEAALRRQAEAWRVPAGDLIHPVRLAVSGTTVGPGLFELLEYLGRGEVVGRVGRAAEFIKAVVNG